MTEPTTPPLVQFGDYSLRSVQEGDRAQLDDWIAEDEEHRDKFEASDFIDAGPNILCYALADGQGDVLYIRLSRAARVRIQFGPESSKKEKHRAAAALFHGMAFIEAMLRQIGVEEWIFDTSNPELAAFATARLGFTASPNELRRPIAPPDRQNGQGGPAYANGKG
jgi:hypothetical protein